MTIGSKIDKNNEAISKRLSVLEKQNAIMIKRIEFLQDQVVRVNVELHGHIRGLNKVKNESDNI